ncbi:hypothetical protein INR49_031430 [Caranx melampygus]|nr:hypothetical protein INR49_031430 [Caranx melampygus]
MSSIGTGVSVRASPSSGSAVTSLWTSPSPSPGPGSVRYDLSASTFSPDGRVFQVEYAMKAVENSSTAIGIRCKDGVVFGVEKLVLSKLYEEGSNKRIFNIDRHVGMLFPVEQHLSDRVAMYVHAYTLYSAVRPFGCSFILGSYDKDDGPQLYMVDPSGISYGYWGCAIGKAKQAAKTEIEKLQMKEMTCRELVKEVAKIIYIVHDEVKDKAFELELSWVGERKNQSEHSSSSSSLTDPTLSSLVAMVNPLTTPLSPTVTNGRHELVPKDVREEAEKYAKDSLEEEDDSDEDNITQPMPSFPLWRRVRIDQWRRQKRNVLLKSRKRSTNHISPWEAAPSAQPIAARETELGLNSLLFVNRFAARERGSSRGRVLIHSLPSWTPPRSREHEASAAVAMVKKPVTLKGESTSQVVQDDQVKGPLRVGSTVEVKTNEGLSSEAVISKLTDASLYTTLDQLPLTNPEHFGTPVMGKKSNRGGRRSSQAVEDEEDDRRRLNDELLGKVCSIEDEEEPSSWYLALVVSPSCNDELVVKKDQCLVRSFSDSKFHTVARRHVHAVNSISIARSEFSGRRGFEAAQMFLRSRDVPDVWKMDMSQILDSSSSDDEEEEEDKESDEEEEDEDEKKKKKLIKEEVRD